MGESRLSAHGLVGEMFFSNKQALESALGKGFREKRLNRLANFSKVNL